MIFNIKLKSIWSPITIYVFLAFGLSIWILQFTNYLTPDGVSYIRMAQSIFAGHGISINPGEPYVRHPPFYSFLIGLANFAFHDWEFSAHFISVFAFSLTLIPLFFLTKQIYSKTTAHWVCLLYATNGFLLIYSNLIMTEPLFILLIMIQLYCVFLIINGNTPRYRLGILLGLLGGLTYLTRPEGMLYYFAGLVGILLLDSNSLQSRIRLCLVSLPFFLIISLPYVAFLTKTTGHLQFSGLARENILFRYLDLTHPGHYQDFKKIYQGLSDDKKRLRIDDLVDQFNLIGYLTNDHFILLRSGFESLITRILGFSNYFFGGLGFIFVGASFLSIPWDEKRRKYETLLILFVLPFFVHLFLLFDSRRFLPLMPIFLIWTGNGMHLFVNWSQGTFGPNRIKSRGIAILPFLIFSFASGWYLCHCIHSNYFPAAHKALGLWMKQNIPNLHEEKVALSPYHFVNFYSNSRIMNLPYTESFEDFLTYMKSQKAKYFVISEDLEPPIRESYKFLLDETKPLPPGILKIYAVEGSKKAILYEIA